MKDFYQALLVAGAITVVALAKFAVEVSILKNPFR